MVIEIRKATRTKAKLRVGFSGPSGSGKTYSALLIAKAIAGDMKDVCIIDTEQGSADLYSNLGEFSVIRMNDDPKDETPFAPERYIAAIRAAEQANFKVCIIDSVTHEWDGKGGLLESNEKLANAKFKGNTWAAWSDTTPRHQRFIDAIVSSPMHILTTVRNKVETVQIDGKVKKVGTKEVQREGFEYELTVNFTIDRDKHYALASKDRTGIFDSRDPFIITEQTGLTLKEWAEQGVDPAEMEAKKKAALEAKEKEQAVLREKANIMRYAKALGFIAPSQVPAEILESITKFISAMTQDVYHSDLPVEQLSEISGHLAMLMQERKENQNKGDDLSSAI